MTHTVDCQVFKKDLFGFSYFPLDQGHFLLDGWINEQWSNLLEHGHALVFLDVTRWNGVHHHSKQLSSSKTSQHKEYLT
jgi:hypothetical protein